MSGQPRGLGRGLNALIPQTEPGSPLEGSQAATSPAGVLEVPVGDILPNPRQPRSRIDTASLEELAASIREHGLIQPLIVTRAQPTDRAPFQLIAGERRWRAAKLAGLTVVPVLLKEASPQGLLELALVENIQRADLNPLEEAEAFQALISEFKLSQQEVADRVGKSRVAVANIVRLLRLPDQVKALVADGALSEGHARALLALPDDEMIVRAAVQIVEHELTVRQTEELVRRLLAAADADAIGAAAVGADAVGAAAVGAGDESGDPDASYTRRLEDAFRSALGTKVVLSRSRKGGRLVISFYSDEELQVIYQRIVGEDR